MTTATPEHERTGHDPAGLTAAQSLLFDVLRLLAAQVVLLGHAFDFFDWNSSLHDPTHPQIQRLAVTVFFLLSGFLIPWSVARRSGSAVPHMRSNGNQRFIDYLVARATRIYAGLLPALVFIAVVDWLPAHRFELDYPPVPGSGAISTWFANLFHLQEFPGLGLPIFGTGDPLWSLAVEWWIYILFGLLALRPSGLWLLLWVPASISVAWNTVYGTGDGIAMVWCLGWAAYILWHRGRRLEQSAQRNSALWIIGAAAFAVGVWSAARWGSRSHFGLDLPFAGTAAVTLVAWLLALDGGRATQSRPRRAFGIRGWVRSGADTSFTLYLTHFSVLTLLYEWRGHLSPLAMVLAAVLLCNAVAWVLSWCGERHTGSLRAWLRQRITSGTPM